MEEIRFTRKELYDLVWSESLPSLAKKYKLSDNSLRKRCKKINIPLPPAGYWQKKKHGYPVKKEPLPKYHEGETETILCYRDKKGNYVSAEESSFLRLKRDIENNPDVPGYFGLIVPGVSVKMCQSERGYNNTKISY